jgi:hypothetical protein
MNVNVRPVFINGEQRLLLSVPGGVITTQTPDQARQLIADLTRALMTNPPVGPDDGGHGYR